LATGDLLEEFEYTGGLASFADDNHLYLPGGGGGPQAYDLRSGERTPWDEIGDPALRGAIQGRGDGTFPYTFESAKYRLRRAQWDYQGNTCRGEDELCDGERFETWTLEEVATGEVLLAFRAYNAGPAGPGELVIATSPQCESDGGELVWCAETLEAIRAEFDSGERSSNEVHGTTNIFIVDIETGAAEFVATANFSATGVYSWPQNWPLSADGEHIVWTGAFCSQETPGKTRIFDRATGQITELNISAWAQLTPRGDIGIGSFGPRAILDIELLQWNVVLPDGIGDVVQSPGGRYLAKGGILGHGGLC
jgi:hypothetical protein